MGLPHLVGEATDCSGTTVGFFVVFESHVCGDERRLLVIVSGVELLERPLRFVPRERSRLVLVQEDRPELDARIGGRESELRLQSVVDGLAPTGMLISVERHPGLVEVVSLSLCTIHDSARHTGFPIDAHRYAGNPPVAAQLLEQDLLRLALAHDQHLRQQFCRTGCSSQASTRFRRSSHYRASNISGRSPITGTPRRRPSA